MPLLQSTGLVKKYGRRTVVDGVSFEVHAGEVVGLLGPNGAGKTTSFRMTTGQITPFAGRVYFNGQDVTALPMYMRARLGMGYLAQETSVFRKLTCEQNVLAVLELMPASRTLKRALTRRERWERTEVVLEQFGLQKVRKTVAARLSGGEKRRLEIARCLVCEPLLILLDEPFTGIDPITIAEIRSIVKGLRSRGIGLLLTDHNVKEALKITTRSYLIKDGKVRTHGSPQEIVNDPIAINEYLGKDFSDNTYGDGDPLPPHEMLTFTGGAAPEPTPKPANPMDAMALVEKLRTGDSVEASADLIQMGRTAVPMLLGALERPDVELRHEVVNVLQTILDRPIAFDPYAPAAQRKQQLANLREQIDRKAG
jgi:lipopolysaccharide export system ATP-binding protein